MRALLLAALLASAWASEAGSGEAGSGDAGSGVPAPSGPPSSPLEPPPPGWTRSPAPPPVTYPELEGEEEDFASEAIIGITVGAILMVAVLAFALLLAMNKPADTSPVSKSGLQHIMSCWGAAMGKPFISGPCFVAVFLFFVVLSTGMREIEQSEGQPWDWVPSGTRYERQLKEWDRLVDNSVTDRTHAYILVRSEDEDENLLDNPEKWLDILYRTTRAVYGKPLPGDEGYEAAVQGPDVNGAMLDLSWKDFCFSINHPILTSPVPGLSNGTGTNFKPCIQPSALDPFKEQAWEFDASSPDAEIVEKAGSFGVIENVADVACNNLAQEQACGQVNDVLGYPSFYGLPRERIIERMTLIGNGAGHWLDAGSQPWGKLYGKFVGTNGGCPESATDAQGNVDIAQCDLELTVVKSLAITLYQDIPAEVVKFRKTVMGMTPDAFRDANMAWLKELGNRLEALDKRTDGTWGDAKINYYPSDALDRMYAELSDAAAVMIVLGYGLMLVFVVLSQIPWCSCETHLFLAPLGLVGFFLILLANAGAYGLIAWGLNIKFNMTMLQALPFLALGLGVDDLFLVLHSFKDTMKVYKGCPASAVLSATFQEAGASITITSWCNMLVFFGGAGIIPIPALQAFLLSAGFIVLFNWLCAIVLLPPMLALWAHTFADGATTTAEAERKAKIYADEGELTLGLEGFYKAFSESMVLKCAFFTIGAGLLIAFSSMIPFVEMGYEEADLAKRGSYLGEGITEMYKQFYAQHSSETIVFGEGIDFEKDQEQILRTFDTLAASEWSAYGTALGKSGVAASCWLRNMYGSPEITPWRGIYGNHTCEPINANNESDVCYYIPDPDWAFTTDLHLWRKPAILLAPRSQGTIAFGGLLAGLLDRANSFAYQVGPGDGSAAADDAYYASTNKLVLSWDEMEIQADKVKKTSERIKMIKYFKDTLEASGLNIYMYSWLFIQMEQFLNLDYYFWQAASVAMVAVFVVALLLGLSWLGAAIIAVFSIFVALEVYGALYVFGISYQSFSTVSMLMSIGIAVEFTAHPIAAFEFATGTANERLAKAMRRTASPVLFGAISSFVGFAFLAASDFQFVVKYFFGIFLMICVFGAINGLVFVPAVLGLFGTSREAPAESGRKDAGAPTVVAVTSAASVSAASSTSYESPKAGV